MKVIDALKERRSIRKYRKTRVSKSLISQVMEAAVLAPTAKNLQPFRFLVITDKKTIQALPEACRGQTWLADAPVVICAYGRERDAYPGMGEYYNSLETDTAIAMDHMMLRAHELGLGTCWIGAFSQPRVRKILNIPRNYRILCLTPLGYAAEKGRLRPRKKAKELFTFFEKA